MKLSSKWRSLGWWINAGLLMFAGLLTLALTVQGNLSQGLIEHRLWRQVLESSTQSVLRIPPEQLEAALPVQGAVRGWLLANGNAGNQTMAPGMPPYLARLAPGYYNESVLDTVYEPSAWDRAKSILTPHWGPFADQPGSEREPNYSVLVTAIAQGKLIMAIDMTDLDDEQNGSVQISVLFLLVNLFLIALMSWWLHRVLTAPINDLARRMRGLDALQPSQRLPTNYKKNELNIIAEETNAHLARVELALERERSLLDQASHEFRTPVAIIAGAADVLHQQQLPERTQRPLRRITEAVATLTQIMEALLYLSREAGQEQGKHFTVLQALLPDLLRDHAYLLAGKPVRYVLGKMEHLIVGAPESMVRIAAGNLLRNAAEHTHEGQIEVSLAHEVLCIHDSGDGFDPAAAAQRYTQSLRCDDTRPGSSGLGLFLTQRICERFGWRLTIDSTPALGTAARIHFGTPAPPEVTDPIVPDLSPFRH